MTNNINIRRQTKSLVTITSGQTEHELVENQSEIITNPWKSSIRIAGVSNCSAS
jgi:hypothetical protein